MTLIWPSETILVRAADAELLGTTPDIIQLLADGGDPDQGGAVAGMSAIRAKMSRGTQGPPPHYHSGAAEMFFIIEGDLHVLTGQRVVTVREGDFLLVPPNTSHAFATPAGTGVDMLFLMPGVQRFEYFRLADRVRRGAADPREILENQDRFDNHFQDNPVWREFLGGRSAGANK